MHQIITTAHCEISITLVESESCRACGLWLPFSVLVVSSSLLLWCELCPRLSPSVGMVTLCVCLSLCVGDFLLSSPSFWMKKSHRTTIGIRMWLFLSHPPPPNTHLHTHAYDDKYPVTCLCEHGTEGSTPSPWGWQGSGLWDSSLDLSFTSSNSLAVRRKHLSRITTAVAPFLYVCSQGFAEINISCDSVWWMCTRNSEVKGYTQTVLTYIQTRRQDLNDSIPMETWLVVWKLNRKGQVISFWGDSEG